MRRIHGSTPYLAAPVLTSALLAGAAVASFVTAFFAFGHRAAGRRQSLLAVAFTVSGAALTTMAVVPDATAIVASLWIVAFGITTVAVFPGQGRPRLRLTGGSFLSHVLTPGSSASGDRHPRGLVQYAGDAFVLVDAKGVITFASESIRRVLGHHSDEVVGRSVFDAVFDDDVGEARAVFQTILDQRAGSAFIALRANHVDGSTRWLEVAGTNLIEDESVRAIVLNLRDLSEQRHAEEALRRSEAGYRGLVENAIYGVYRSDPAGHFLTVNPALVRMLGYDSEEELLALDVATDVYVDPHHRKALIERYHDADRITGVEVEWKRRDGSRILIWLSGNAQRDDRGRVQSFEMIVEDITERRTLEAQLRQAQKMEAIGQLAGGIAHDFNNLLTVILANADIIEVTVGESPVREELHDLRGSAQHGRDLVKKLLGYGRRDMLEVRPINLTELVQDMLSTLKRVLPASIEIRFSASVTETVIEADTGAIQQMLFNLATNARDAMDGEGTIRMEVGAVRSSSHPALTKWRARGEFARLAVSDTGHGMDEETKAKVFDPFFTTKPPGVGTGLGMAMIYGLVKQQNGFVDIQTAVGKGTTVELFFPVVAAAPELPPAKDAPAMAVEGTELILVVEDEGAIRIAATEC